MTISITRDVASQKGGPPVVARLEEYRRIVGASFWTFGVIAMATLSMNTFLARGYPAVALPIGTVGLLASRV